MIDERKARLIELAKQGELVGAERDEFVGLSAEFPETAKELEAKQAEVKVEPKVEVKKTV